MKKRYLWILLSFLFIAGCESLEDTYSDFAGDGSIRHLGGCKDVTVKPGWKRFAVTWKNSVDPLIDKIKVTWSANGVLRDTLLERTVDSVSLPSPDDGSYEITVCNMDKQGNTSMVSTQYGRPYTYAHESVISFSRLISKQFIINDQLILFFSGWQEHITNAYLTYDKADHTPGSFQLTAEVVNAKYLRLPDAIDPTKPIILEREGRIEGCPDLIQLEPYELSHEKIYTTEFKNWIKIKYGQAEFTEEFVEQLEELEIDYSIRTFTDILNLPNLKKLILGKNRYLYPMFTFNPNVNSDSKLTEVDESIFAITTAHELWNMKVERYNEHYFSNWDKPDFVTSMTNLPAPNLYFLTVGKDWDKKCSVELNTEQGNLDLLFDGDPQTNWWPQQDPVARTYEITLDMKTPQDIAGVRVSQMYYFRFMLDYAALLPPSLKIKYSNDGISWEDVAYLSEITIGATLCEITDIHFPAVRNTRYLKFILYDRPYNDYYSVALGGIDIFGPQPE